MVILSLGSPLLPYPSTVGISSPALPYPQCGKSFINNLRLFWVGSKLILHPQKTWLTACSLQHQYHLILWPGRTGPPRLSQVLEKLLFSQQSSDILRLSMVFRLQREFPRQCHFCGSRSAQCGHFIFLIEKPCDIARSKVTGCPEKRSNKGFKGALSRPSNPAQSASISLGLVDQALVFLFRPFLKEEGFSWRTRYQRPRPLWPLCSQSQRADQAPNLFPLRWNYYILSCKGWRANQTKETSLPPTRNSRLD